MSKIVLSRYLAAIVTAMVLAACGGGGGGGGGGLGFFGLPVTSGGASGASGDMAGQVTVSGKASYDFIPNSTTGALDYGAMSSKPVRGAVVEVLDSASTVLATTTTNASGTYSVSIPANGQVFVRVKAQMLQTGSSGATWNFSIRDNTSAAAALYVMDSPSFASGTAASTRDLHAASGWGGSSYTGTRAAAPFALLDTVYTATQKVLSVAPGAAFPELRVFWSVNNRPDDGDPSQGLIGTTAFSDDGTNPRAIYVLGDEDVDTDEYDASVIAHEWGHYYQSAFSRDDSPGGDHSGSQLLDRRVAFSEGWGDAWSGIALARSNYTDSVGARQSQGVIFELSAGPTTNPGWYREQSIQSILWRLNQQVGFQPIHAAMSGGLKTSVAMTSIHSFTAAFNAVTPGNASALTGLLSQQNISTAANDPFGAQETSKGGIDNALPMYIPAPANAVTTACVSNSAGFGNKLGNYVYLRTTLATAGSHQITVTGPGNADPDFEVDSAGLLAISDAFGATETATVAMHQGDNVIVLNDFNNSSASTCFKVQIN